MNFDPRDLEWQRRYEERDTPWDKGAPAPPLVEYLKGHQLKGRALVPGCGRGHEIRALLEMTDCTVVGLDLSKKAVQEAQHATDAWISSKFTESNSQVERSRFSFLEANFFNLPSELLGTFDWIIEHTCFCAIDPSERKKYVQAAAQSLVPGGLLFGIFYVDPGCEGGPPFGVTPLEITELFAKAFNLEAEWVPQAAFPGRENRELVQVLRKR